MREYENGTGIEGVEHRRQAIRLRCQRVVGLGRPARESGAERLDDDRSIPQGGEQRHDFAEREGATAEPGDDGAPPPAHASTCSVSAAATTTYGCCGEGPPAAANI